MGPTQAAVNEVIRRWDEAPKAEVIDFQAAKQRVEESRRTHWPRTSTLNPLLREAVAEIDRLARLKQLAKKAAWLHGCCWDLSDEPGGFIPKDPMARSDEVFSALGEELGEVVLDEEDERVLVQQPFARAQRAEAEVERLRAELADASARIHDASPIRCRQWPASAALARCMRAFALRSHMRITQGTRQGGQ